MEDKTTFEYFSVCLLANKHFAAKRKISAKIYKRQEMNFQQHCFYYSTKNTHSQNVYFHRIWRILFKENKKSFLKCLYPALQSAPVTTSRQGKRALNWAGRLTCFY